MRTGTHPFMCPEEDCTMHHKRRRPKHRRAGCLLCKPHKDERLPKCVRLKGLKVPRRLTRVVAGGESHL